MKGQGGGEEGGYLLTLRSILSFFFFLFLFFLFSTQPASLPKLPLLLLFLGFLGAFLGRPGGLGLGSSIEQHRASGHRASSIAAQRIASGSDSCYTTGDVK